MSLYFPRLMMRKQQYQLAAKGAHSSRMAVDYTSEGGVYDPEIKAWQWYVFCPEDGEERYDREGAPAVIYDDGSWCYYKMGYLHNLNGYAAFGALHSNYAWAVEGVVYDDEEEYREACYEYRCKNGGILTKGTLGAT